MSGVQVVGGQSVFDFFFFAVFLSVSGGRRRAIIIQYEQKEAKDKERDLWCG